MQQTFQVQGKDNVYEVIASSYTLTKRDIMLMQSTTAIKLGVEEARLCPHCEVTLKENDAVVCLESNYKLFPETLIHKHCFEEEDITEQCKRLNKQYMEFLKTHKIWNI